MIEFGRQALGVLVMVALFGCEAFDGAFGPVIDPADACARDVVPFTPRVENGRVCVNSNQCEPLFAARVYETDHRRALDLLFVAEAYRTDQLDSFRRRVDDLVREMAADTDSLVGRAWPNVNVYRLDLSSPTDEVLNADPTDTALGGCLALPEVGNSTPGRREEPATQAALGSRYRTSR